MSDVRFKKEFIYKLGKKYHVMGDRVCKECTDSTLINLYDQYEKTMAENGFYNITDNDGLRKMASDRKTMVGEAYKKCADAVFLGINVNPIPIEERELRDDLDRSYSDEIDKQIKLWVFANKCTPPWETIKTN